MQEKNKTSVLVPIDELNITARCPTHRIKMVVDEVEMLDTNPKHFHYRIHAWCPQCDESYVMDLEGSDDEV